MTARATAENLFVFESGGENSLRTLFDPWSPDCGETAYLPYYFFAVRHPAGWVLVDCGAHPDLASDPIRRLGDQVEFSDIVMGSGADVVSRLAEIGVRPDEVTDVVITHLHYDHCGGLELLPAAKVHLQRSELAFAENPPVYQELAYVRADWAGVRNWVLHDGEHDLFGDGAILLVPTPGHTPGHQSVLVRLPQGAVICVGDAAYHPEKMAERRLPGYLWNPDALVASWELLEQLQAEHGATLLFSHYPEPAAVPLAPSPFLADPVAEPASSFPTITTVRSTTA